MLEILFIVFLASVCVQILFMLLCFSRVSFYNRKKHAVLNNTLPVSVVVCARNEEQNLKKLLDALIIQNHSDFEVIVVDDCSDDSSYDILIEESLKHNNLKIVKVDKVPSHINSKKYGLTLGIKAAKNDIILLTDADCIPQGQNWISEMTGPFAKEKIQIVLGFSQYEKRKGFLNSFIRFETLYTGIQYLSAALLGRPYMGVGRNLAYRKSFFLEKKGFNTFQRVIGGDDDLFVNRNATRSNTAIVVGSGSVVTSRPKTSYSRYFLQKSRHLSVGRFYSLFDKIYLGILSLSHMIFWVSFITLMIHWWEPYWVIGGFLARILLLTIIYASASKKIGGNTKGWVFPVLDFVYVLYYIRAGLSAILTKKIEWK